MRARPDGSKSVHLTKSQRIKTMPATIPAQSITFENNRTAKAVFPMAGDKPGDIIDALDLVDHKAVLLIIGGADNLADALKPKLTQLFGPGIAPAAMNLNAGLFD